MGGMLLSDVTDSGYCIIGLNLEVKMYLKDSFERRM